MGGVRIGTRSSRLALTQARSVADGLAASGVTAELVEIRTRGDEITDVPLGPHLGSSFFTKEIEAALLDGRIDLAVHSCKDLATVLPEGLEIVAFPLREDPRDVVVARSPSILASGSTATVGTSSPRRKGLLAHLHPGLSVVDQRGNVPTRVRAVDDGVLDGAVLAAAGLLRLGMRARITAFFDPARMVPAAGQGALALQGRSDDEATRRLVAPLDHPATRVCVESERACLRRLGAGCQAPVGAAATLNDDRLTLRVALVAPDGVLRAHIEAAATKDPDEVGTQAAEALLVQLGVSSLREAEWAGAPPARSGGAR